MPALAAPGIQFAHTSEISDQKLGSVLFYPIVTSSATSGVTQNTRISITNADTQRAVAVHLFFIDGTSCSVADMFMCLSKGQTATFLASEFDPGTTGYLIVVAVNNQGCPTVFNALMGDEYVKFAGGHRANLPADSAAGLIGLITSPVCDDTSSVAQLRFDGFYYNRLARVVAASNIPDRASGNDTMLILNRIGGNLGLGTSPLPPIFGLLYNDRENSYSFSFIPSTCQVVSSLTNNFPRTAPRIETVIPAGHSGWMKLYAFDADVPLFGATLVFNPDTVTSSSAFAGGRNLHKLTLSAAGVLTIPVFPPNC
ncbi:MAG TPA: hypothetical protein PLD20_34845 [Blastocatellia bacterium]|nr:hypothetical protein [Blastocatellia bacterium]HMY71679.1 hypothetical protein [Blastocatellia bacterium]HMZ23154.1 hypothetical protein [Blastocatellia bacterium]HNG33134.1 hypothetical protein [Blastocatellia bacterium]